MIFIALWGEGNKMNGKGEMKDRVGKGKIDILGLVRDMGIKQMKCELYIGY